MTTIHTEVLPEFKGFTATFNAEVEYDAYDTGQPDIDRRINADIDSGGLVLFVAVITLSHSGVVLGSSALGSCCYKDFSDFLSSGYIPEMLEEGYQEALAKLKSINDAINN